MIPTTIPAAPGTQVEIKGKRPERGTAVAHVLVLFHDDKYTTG